MAALPETRQPEAEAPETGLPELDDPAFIKWAKERWGIRFKRGQARCLIHGSPERSLSRGVVCDDAGRQFLVEKFDRRVFKLKERIARTLHLLHGQGLTQVLTPEPDADRNPLAFFGTACFQVTRFVEGTELQRPQWLSSEKMGAAMAGFLARMKHCARCLDIQYPSFSIKDYIYKLFGDMAVHCPDRHAQYLPVLKFLEQRFMAAHDSLTKGFCHGDLHPLNVIWDGPDIKAVIDWEFTGIKPDCHDAANLVGCAGIEHPEGLAMPLLTTFLSRLRRADAISPQGWQWLPEYVLALRFAWLSEWLRKDDQEMLETERKFMDILMAHMDDLRDIWAGHQG